MGSNPTLSAKMPMNLTDTHCHLNHETFFEQVEPVIARAEAAGVHRLFVIGYDLPSSARAIHLAEKSPSIYAVVGIHPHSASECDEATLDRLRQWTQHPRVVAIGEIGLDFYRNLVPKETQSTAFRAQLKIAQEANLPVVIHCREAYDELLQVLEEHNGVQGVLHCFSGTGKHAEKGVKMGFYLGIGGVITFKNAGTLRSVVQSAPLERLLLETDAPYLAPHPYRGKTNEPAYLPLITQAVADLKSLDLDTLSRIAEQNVHRLFSL